MKTPFKYLIQLILITVFLSVTQAAHRGRPIVTKVTSVYDLKNRKIPFYMSHLQKILQTPTNLIIFGDKEIKKIVKNQRNNSNTIFIQRQLSWFDQQWWNPLVDKIRKEVKSNPSNAKMYRRSPQYSQDHYFSMSVSKAFLIEQAMKQDVFSSDYYVWIDFAMLGRNQKDILSPQSAIQKMTMLSQQPWFFHLDTQADPYVKKFQGFRQKELRYVKWPINITKTVLADYFGGGSYMVRSFRSVFQNLLRITLQNGDMNSDESLMSLMVVRYPFLIPICSQIKTQQLIGDISLPIPHYLRPKVLRHFKATFKHSINHAHKSIQAEKQQQTQIKTQILKPNTNKAIKEKQVKRNTKTSAKNETKQILKPQLIENQTKVQKKAQPKQITSPILQQKNNSQQLSFAKQNTGHRVQPQKPESPAKTLIPTKQAQIKTQKQIQIQKKNKTQSDLQPQPRIQEQNAQTYCQNFYLRSFSLRQKLLFKFIAVFVVIASLTIYIECTLRSIISKEQTINAWS